MLRSRNLTLPLLYPCFATTIDDESSDHDDGVQSENRASSVIRGAKRERDILTRYVGSDVKTAELLRPYWLLAAFLVPRRQRARRVVHATRRGPTSPCRGERSIITRCYERTLALFPLRLLSYFAFYERRPVPCVPLQFATTSRGSRACALVSRRVRSLFVKITRAHADYFSFSSDTRVIHASLPLILEHNLVFFLCRGIVEKFCTMSPPIHALYARESLKY